MESKRKGKNRKVTILRKGKQSLVLSLYHCLSFLYPTAKLIPHRTETNREPNRKSMKKYSYDQTKLNRFEVSIKHSNRFQPNRNLTECSEKGSLMVLVGAASIAVIGNVEKLHRNHHERKDRTFGSCFDRFQAMVQLQASLRVWWCDHKSLPVPLGILHTNLVHIKHRSTDQLQEGLF